MMIGTQTDVGTDPVTTISSGYDTTVPTTDFASLDDGDIEGTADENRSESSCERKQQIPRQTLKTKTAHRDGTCQYCLGTVQAEIDGLFPVQQSLCRLARSKQTLTCQPSIVVAARSVPISSSTEQQDNRILWIHERCAFSVFDTLKIPPSPPICRHWFRSGNRQVVEGQPNPKCPFDNECYFLHPPMTDASPTSEDENNHSWQQQLPPPVLCHRRTWGGRRRKLFKPTTAIFRHWVLQTFGHDYLLNGQRYVLDIAGGNGRLAFELENLSGIKTCVIDPRPLTLKKAYNKWKSGFYDKAKSSPRLNRFLTHYDRTVTPKYPAHMRIFFDDALTQRIVEYNAQQQQQEKYDEGLQDKEFDHNVWWAECLDVARRRTWTPKGLEEDKSGPGNSTTLTIGTASASTKKGTLVMIENDIELEEELENDDTNRDAGAELGQAFEQMAISEKVALSAAPSFTGHKRESENFHNNTSSEEDNDDWLSRLQVDVQDASEALSIMSDCSMVIGLHPDQATEAAVDFALAMNKPFAVVPCCVFSSHFPNRRLRGSTQQQPRVRVKTTSQLVQYLCEKDERIRFETLPFEGMNQVVYMTPDQIM